MIRSQQENIYLKRELGMTFDELIERFMTLPPGKKDWLMKYIENGMRLVEKDLKRGM